MVAELTRAGVRFVVIGGFAARAHGSTRITEDIDICYDPSPDNVRRLAGVLREWHAYMRGADAGLPFVMDERTFKITPIMTLITDRGAIDVMHRVEGVGEYPEVLASSEEIISSETRFRVLDLPGLLKAKRATKRPKDAEQIPELEALLELRERNRRKRKGKK
jgi:hypothetical protein